MSAAQEVIHRGECQSCGTPVTVPLMVASGIEPLYDLKMAAYLIPMRLDTLKKCLGRHRSSFPPLYRLQGRMHRRIRVLSASEIKLVRALSLRGKSIERITAMTLDATVDGLLNMPRTAEPSCLMEIPPLGDFTPEEVAEISRELGTDEEMRTSVTSPSTEGGPIMSE